MNKEEIISDDDCLALIKIARNAIELRLTKIASLAQLSATQKHFPQKRGAFISLHKNNKMLKCMGSPWPVKSLNEAVEEAAIKSAFPDSQKPMLAEADLNNFKIELTITTKPTIIVPDQIKIGLHGLIIHSETHSGLLLPHIPIEYGWNVNAFLAGTSIKAGLPIDGWKYSKIYAFEVQVYREN
jgi:AmmeMemoRadiSam system protein A